MLRRILLAALSVLASCGHPTGVYDPVALTANTPKTSQVEMLVATTLSAFRKSCDAFQWGTQSEALPDGYRNFHSAEARGWHRTVARKAAAKPGD